MGSRMTTLDAWLDRFFKAYYRLHPVNATFIGVHEYDDRLPDYSRNGVTDAVAACWKLLDDLGALGGEAATPAQAVDRKLAEGYLRVRLWEYGSGHFQAGNPSHYVGEAVFVPLSMFLREARPLEQRRDGDFWMIWARWVARLLLPRRRSNRSWRKGICEYGCRSTARGTSTPVIRRTMSAKRSSGRCRCFCVRPGR